MKTDKIFIKNLLLRCIIGINDWERENLQDVLINLTIFFDQNKAGRSDNIVDTLNYRTLTKQIIEYVENSKHFLVETLASKIAEICVKNFGANKVVVKLEKPNALRFAESVGVEIERGKADFE